MVMSLIEHETYLMTHIIIRMMLLRVFQKELSYTDTCSNWINDSGIKVSMQFEKSADYKNFRKNEN